MVKLLKALSLVLAVAGVDARAISWAKGGQFCGGIEETTGSAADASTSKAEVSFGYCSGASPSTEDIMKTSFSKVVAVKESTYLTTSSDSSTFDFTPGGKEYVDVGSNADPKYVFVSRGAMFGTEATQKAFIAISSYLNTGVKDIVAHSNEFYSASPTETTPVKRGDSEHGAPSGPWSGCITKLVDGQCKTKGTWGPGAFKFSIYFVAYGADWNSDSWKTGGKTHGGLRMLLELSSKSKLSITAGGTENTLDNVGNKDVTAFKIIQSDGTTLTYTFPTHYNVGSTTGQTGGSGEMNLPTASKTIKIKLSKGTTSATGKMAINIDYLFDINDLKQDAYLIYDPDVVPGTTSSFSSANPQASVQAALLAPFLAALAGLFIR